MSYLENVESKRNAETALRHEEKSMSLNRVKIDEDTATILLMSDEHLGANNYYKDLHERVLEHAYNKDWHVLHLGDGIESATRNSVGAGVYSQDEILDSQIANWTALYKPFVDKGCFIGAHPGNHELRVMNDDGIDIMRQMCRMMGARYLGMGKTHLIRVGNQTYTMYTTHGSSGARMPYTKIKGCLDLERVVDAEIYAMGHLHQLSHHVRNFYGIDRSKKKVETQSKHFILTGSYLDYPGSYAQVKCMEPARMGSPLLRLSGTDKQIKVSLQ
jgi:hypothetical protein